jgi:hypothetical protein
VIPEYDPVVLIDHEGRHRAAVQNGGEPLPLLEKLLLGPLSLHELVVELLIYPVQIPGAILDPSFELIVGLSQSFLRPLSLGVIREGENTPLCDILLSARYPKTANGMKEMPKKDSSSLGKIPQVNLRNLDFQSGFLIDSPISKSYPLKANKPSLHWPWKSRCTINVHGTSQE